MKRMFGNPVAQYPELEESCTLAYGDPNSWEWTFSFSSEDETEKENLLVFRVLAGAEFYDF